MLAHTCRSGTLPRVCRGGDGGDDDVVVVLMMMEVLVVMVEAVEATGLVLKNNVIAGCERLGYHLPGQDCSTPTGGFIMVVIMTTTLMILL